MIFFIKSVISFYTILVNLCFLILNNLQPNDSSIGFSKATEGVVLPHNFQGSSINTTAPDRTRGRNGKIKFSITSQFLKIKHKNSFYALLIKH